MNIVIQSIGEKEFSDIINTYELNLPIEISPNSIKCYKEKEIIIAKEKENILAIYVLPIYKTNDKIWVERTYRYFPYLSPFFLKGMNRLRRKIIIFEIFKYIFQKYDLMYMPMHPKFKDVAAIQSLGAFVEYRHTHVINKKFQIENVSSKLRNCINYAKNRVIINKCSNGKDFRFDIAIKGSKEEQCLRKKSAINLLENSNAMSFSAVLKDKKENCAGVMIMYDTEWAYLLHSWQKEDTPRGTMSFLIYEAIKWAFDEKHIKHFDFEGSVIQNIDTFFSGFNANIEPYAYIHFAKQYKDLEKLINISKDIEGRKILDLGGNKNECDLCN